MSNEQIIVEIHLKVGVGGYSPQKDAAKAVTKSLIEMGYDAELVQETITAKAVFPTRIDIKGTIVALLNRDLVALGAALSNGLDRIKLNSWLGHLHFQVNNEIKNKNDMYTALLNIADTLSILRATHLLEKVDEINIDLNIEDELSTSSRFDAGKEANKVNEPTIRASSLDGSRYEINITNLSVVDITTNIEIARATEIKTQYTEHYKALVEAALKRN